MNRLPQQIEEFAARVRQHPAEANGAALENLLQAARKDRSGNYTAQMSPAAPTTWLTRGILPSTVQATGTIPLYIPYPCRIVGAHIEHLGLPVDEQRAPPNQALDVYVQINRKDGITARADQNLAQDEDANVVSLYSLDAVIANRLIDLELPETQGNHIGVQLRWSVPLATVASFGWSDVQVSINWFIDPFYKGHGWRI